MQNLFFFMVIGRTRSNKINLLSNDAKDEDLIRYYMHYQHNV